MSGMCLVDKLVAPLSLLIQVVVIGVKKSLLLILKNNVQVQNLLEAEIIRYLLWRDIRSF